MELIGFYFISYAFGVSRQIYHDTLTEDSWEWEPRALAVCMCDDPRLIAPAFFLLR